MKRVKKAIIPAAGYGTRNLPITKVLPKEMIPICGRPAIDYIVQEAIESGIEDILIVVSRSKNLILDYYDTNPELEEYLKAHNKAELIEKLQIPNVRIQYVRQNYASGLGSAVNLGKRFVGDEPFAVLLPDEIILSKNNPPLLQLIDMYQNYKAASIIGLKVVDDSLLKNYGVISPKQIADNQYKIEDIVEKPQESPPSNFAVIGRYIFEPTLFDYLEKTKPGIGSEMQLTDAIKLMLKKHPSYATVIKGKTYDVSKIPEYIALINKVWKSTEK
ncbi:UTP--glucose-1-phosphate uridylyltransferase [Terrilactibacillus laevilacticus]|uniref:UTP--glucose-1-phosphate uridylyltransferase n=1 Tax=Terrilactibacillus laevilacticus TaxID=1380157 RepID=A0ABW5PM20_9BACI|nr:UTP--glucose-1-phosphate uridylyltransferase [Terrilactibacillus laevilacticus]